MYVCMYVHTVCSEIECRYQYCHGLLTSDNLSEMVQDRGIVTKTNRTWWLIKLPVT